MQKGGRKTTQDMIFGQLNADQEQNFNEEKANIQITVDGCATRL